METKQPQTSPAQTRENIMGTMEINPLLVKLSVPMMISMLVQALYNVVDSVFVSHVSESALTAVSLAFSLQNVMIAVGVGTGVGVNAMLSKSLGEKNQSRANATAKNGIFLSLCSFVVFLVIGLTCMKPISMHRPVMRLLRSRHPVSFGVLHLQSGPFHPDHGRKSCWPLPAAPT
mgnify:CR=1 FL=1